MPLTESLSEYIGACFPAIWIESHEHQDALAEIAELCRNEDWSLASWNVHRGLQLAGQPIEDTGGADPLAAIRALNSLASPESSAILILENFHRFLQSAEIIQALIEQIQMGKQNRTFIVVLSPLVNIPIELETLFVVIEHPRPDREQLAEIARKVATEEGELPEGADFERILDAAAGLTRHEAENALSLSIIRHAEVRADVLWELKSQTLRKNGLMELYRGEESFDQLGGLENLKAFCLRTMRNQGHRDPQRRPRGVLLLSPPGCGKTQPL